MKKEQIKKTSNPEITQITLPDERYYEKDGIYYPSVTWILESYPKGIFFYKWLASEGWSSSQAIKETAGDKGSRVHSAIQDLLAGKEVKYGDSYFSELDGENKALTLEEWEALIGFQNFWNEKNPSLIATERNCYSEKHKFAGTIDAVLMIDGKVTIVDWKTGSKIYPHYPMQTAAYLVAEAETGDYKAKQMAIVRIGTNHKVGYELKIFDSKEAKSYFSHFLSVKKTWSLENGDKKPAMTEVPEKIKLTIKKLVKKNDKNTKGNSRKN